MLLKIHSDSLLSGCANGFVINIARALSVALHSSLCELSDLDGLPEGVYLCSYLVRIYNTGAVRPFSTVPANHPQSRAGSHRLYS